MVADTAPARTQHPTIPVRLVLTDTDAADNPRTYEWIVRGWLVAPGLAVHTTVEHGEPLEGRYSLTHLPSGLSLVHRLCARHVDQAAAAAIATGVDWTNDADTVLADTRATTMRDWDWCGYDGDCVAEPYPRPDSRLLNPSTTA